MQSWRLTISVEYMANFRCVVATAVMYALLLCTPTLAVPANFILGDSLVDNGNNNYLPYTLARANLRPNGIDFGNGQPTGRFCNGRTVVDMLMELLGAPTPPPFLAPSTTGPVILSGVNYASGAGGILDDTGYNYVERLSFNAQLANFEKTVAQITDMIGVPQTQTLLNKAIYYIVFGNNDYLNNYLVSRSQSSMQYNPQQYQDLLVSSFRLQLTSLYNLGARKVAVFSVGPLGCLPAQLNTRNSVNGECIAFINDYCANFNAAVRPMLNELNAELPGAMFSYGDAYNALVQFIGNPVQYGFRYSDQACCGSGRFNGALPCLPVSNLCNDRSDYIFWDAFHLTDHVNFILGNDFYSGSQFISPFNIQQLAAM